MDDKKWEYLSHETRLPYIAIFLTRTASGGDSNDDTWQLLVRVNPAWPPATCRGHVLYVPPSFVDVTLGIKKK